MIEKFNIRVYGLLLNDNSEILVADEFEFGMKFTKFPGGGLELGEGLIDGLKREWMEELGQEIEVIDHFYTTDFFQLSGFHSNQQLISIYYLVKPVSDFKITTAKKPFDFKNTSGEMLSFRWLELNNDSKEQLTFPIDKIVINKLIEKPSI